MTSLKLPEERYIISYVLYNLKDYLFIHRASKLALGGFQEIISCPPPPLSFPYRHHLDYYYYSYYYYYYYYYYSYYSTRGCAARGRSPSDGASGFHLQLQGAGGARAWGHWACRKD